MALCDTSNALFYLVYAVILLHLSLRLFYYFVVKQFLLFLF